MAEVLVYCGNQKCGVALNESPDTPVEKRQPCPKCGALLREFDLRVSDEVNVKSFIDIKKKSTRCSTLLDVKRWHNTPLLS